MTHQIFGNRSRPAMICTVFALVALILASGTIGCRIIQPYWSENRNDGFPGQIGQYTIAGGGALDIRSDNFRLVIPAGAAADGTSLNVSMVYEPPIPIGTTQTTGSRVLPPNGFVKLSSAYDVTISPSTTILSRPARLELPFQPDAQARAHPESILVACEHDTAGWSLLVPALDIDHGLAVVETTMFSRWMVVRPVDTSRTFPALTIAMEPATAIASHGRAFATDLKLTHTVTGIDPGSIVSNELTIVGVNGALPPGAIAGTSESRAFPTDSLGRAVLAMNNSPYISHVTQGGSLMYILRFPVTGLYPANLADRLLLRWVIKRSDGFSFQREYPVSLIEAEAPSSGDMGGTPQLVAFIPTDGATDVPGQTPIEMTFDLEMDRSSVVEATTISPAAGTAEATWTDNQHLRLSFPSPWPADTTVTVSLASSAKSLAGTGMATSYEWSFTTRDAADEDPPSLVSIAPASGSVLVPINTRLVLRFSKPMLPSTVEAAITTIRPAVGQLSFDWSADRTAVGILPATQWQSETDHEIEIGSSAADTDGLLLGQPVRFTFRTSAVSGPTVVMIDPEPEEILATAPNALKFQFSRTMNRTLTAGAFSVTPAPNGTPTFGWASGDTELSITWPSSFPEGREVIASFSSAARDKSNLPLSGTTRFRFFTRDTAPPAVVSVLPADGSTDIFRNVPIQLVFSEPMHTTAVVTAIRISPPTDGLTYAWNTAGTHLTITPSLLWPVGSQILLTVDTGATDQSGNGLSAPFILTFQSGSVQAPAVAGSMPPSGSAAVPRSQPLTLAFSQPIQPTSLANALTFDPAPAGGVSISWSADSTIATLTPSPAWANAATVTVTIGTSVVNTTGVGLVATTTVTFTTIDDEAPSVVSITPANGAIDVSTTASLTVLFSEAMDTASVLGTVSLTPAAAGTMRSRISDGGRRFEVSWSQPLSGLTNYTLGIGTDARDTAGNRLVQPISSVFRTLDTSFTDTTPPTVLDGQETPRANAVFVASSTVVSLSFSTAMNQDSVATAFSLKTGGSTVAGSSRWESNRFIFTPSSPLGMGIEYTVRLASSAARLNGVPMAADWVATFTTAPDTAPTLSSTIPADGAVDVPANQSIVLEFSAPMSTGTVAVNVVPEGLGQKTSLWSADQRRLTISYTGGFAGVTSYRVTVGSGARNSFGTSITGGLTFEFTSEAVAGPKVLAISPSVGATDVRRTASLTLTFDMAMDKASTIAGLSTTPTPSGTPTVTWSSGDTVVSLAWPIDLSFGTTYSVQLAETAQSATGQQLNSPFSAYFTVESRPQLVSGSEYPAPGATNVATGTAIRLTFSKPMNQASVASAFGMTAQGAAVSGTISWADSTMTFTPSAALPASATCVVTVTTSARDTNGNTLAAPISWRFDTVTLTGTVWQQLLASDFTATDRFSPRRGHATVSFDNRLWVIGGTDGATFFNDIWSSGDGVSWRLELAHTGASSTTQFSGRTNHACAVFNGRIWLTGGYIDTGTGIDVTDDVWSSADGVTWRLESASAEYWARGDHALFVFDNKLWMVAGQTYDENGLETLLNDVWTSSNGVSWTETVLTSAFFPRRLAAAGVIGGKMFLWGGYGTDAAGAAGPLGDIWYSTNGSLWTLSTVSAPFSARQGAAHAVIDGKAWLIGGFGVSPTGFDECLNDVWTSRDGISWNRLLAHDPLEAGRFSPRQQSGIAATGGRVFLVAGEELYDILNDIWTFD
ncbi:Ig-like domain-containing protein [Candidatus Ozemobacteraceae bacterium]|nr:Ig-like domain-containing protein [Candidatus Ozemobacteraceae bacterium]